MEGQDPVDAAAVHGLPQRGEEALVGEPVLGQHALAEAAGRRHQHLDRVPGDAQGGGDVAQEVLAHGHGQDQDIAVLEAPGHALGLVPHVQPVFRIQEFEVTHHFLGALITDDECGHSALAFSLPDRRSDSVFPLLSGWPLPE